MEHILSGTSMRDVRRFVHKLGLTRIERNVMRGKKQSVEKGQAVQRVYDLASERTHRLYFSEARLVAMVTATLRIDGTSI